MRKIPPFAAQHSLFRAYDIRGTRHYFTSEFVQALGHAFAQLYQSTDVIVIGYDVRLGSDAIAQALAKILIAHHFTVIDLGLVTTPMMAFWAKRYQGHGIMITASHSAKDTLGIKWLVSNASPSGPDIQAFYQSVCGVNSTNIPNQPNSHSILSEPASTIIHLPATTVHNAYIEAIAQVFARIQYENTTVSATNNQNPSKLNITVVIDCMDGATSNIAQPLFERFCQQVIMLNDTPDGNFPTGNPDPTEPNRLAELQQTVIINEADLGLAFDGDGDRLMIVDNRGKVVTSDNLLYLLAQVALTEYPKSKSDMQVIFDIKCSHHLPKLLTAIDAIPIMSRTGSSLLRQQLQDDDNQAIFAGELSGHFIFVSVIMKDDYANYTVALGLYKMLEREHIYAYFTRFTAGAVLVAIPITLLFIKIQKFYVEGVTGGAVKG